MANIKQSLQRRKTLKTIFLLVAATCLALSAQAQVTIGSDITPEKGALLQLKDAYTTDGGVTSTSGGLLLPRVNLTNRTELYPFYTTGAADYTGAARDKAMKNHKGLVVYNLNTTGDGLDVGVYNWDGSKWLTFSNYYDKEIVLLNETRNIEVQAYRALPTVSNSFVFQDGTTEYKLTIPPGMLKEKFGRIDFEFRTFRSYGIGTYIIGFRVAIGGVTQTSSWLGMWNQILAGGDLMKTGHIFINDGKLTVIDEDKYIFKDYTVDPAGGSEIVIWVLAGSPDPISKQTIDYARFVWHP